jgi:putative flippase GtrA
MNIPKYLEQVKSENIRFLVVGAFNTIFGFLIFVIVQYFLGSQITEVGSLVTSHVIASTLAFILHRRVTFRFQGSLITNYMRFQAVFVLPVGINLVILPIFVRAFEMDPYFSQGFISLVTVTLSYFGHKYFSFRK